MKLEVREIKPVEPPKEYVLTLDQNELEVLYAVLNKTGGYDNDLGWRPIVNRLHSGLRRHAKIETYSILGMDGNVLANPKVKPL
jgi:hypothetical protein